MMGDPDWMQGADGILPGAPAGVSGPLDSSRTAGTRRVIPEDADPADAVGAALWPAIEPDAYAMVVDLVRWSAGRSAADPLRRLSRLIAATAAVADTLDTAAHVERDAALPDDTRHQLAEDLTILVRDALAVAAYYDLDPDVRARIRQLWHAEHTRRRLGRG